MPAEVTCIDAPQGMCRAHAVVVDGNVFVGGGVVSGRANTSHNHTIFRYILSERTWSPFCQCPVRYFGLVHFRGRLVTVGGKDQQRAITSKLFTYRDDLHTPIWEGLIQAMPTSRYCLSAVVSTPPAAGCSAILVAGGATKVSGHRPVICSTVEVYNEEASQWSTVDPLPTPCWCMSAVAIGNKCYLLGGNDDKRPLKACFNASFESLLQRATPPAVRQTVQQSAWRTLPPTPLIGSTAAVIGNSLVAMGGENDRDAESQAVYALLNETWVRLRGGDLQSPQSFATTALVSPHEVIVVGGDRQTMAWYDSSTLVRQQ